MRNDASKNKKAPKGMLARLAKAAKSVLTKATSPAAEPAKAKVKAVKAAKAASKPASKPASPPAAKAAVAATAVATPSGPKRKARVAPGVKDSSICREVACESLATTTTYCRLHYIKNWKKIRLKEQILSEGKLNQFIDELVGKYPEKYIEAIRVDLTNDKDFMKVVADLELGEPAEEFEGAGGGDSEGPEEGIIDTIRRDFDEDTETF